jgi:hypothetical protein
VVYSSSIVVVVIWMANIRAMVFEVFATVDVGTLAVLRWVVEIG